MKNKVGLAFLFAFVATAFTHISYGQAKIDKLASLTKQSNFMYISLDSGKTWAAIDEGFQASLCTASISQIGKYLISSHPQGIFRSYDTGKTWNIVLPSVNRAFKISGKTLNTERVFKLYVSGNVVYASTKDDGC